MLVIRLKRTGKTNSPTFRVVVADKKEAVKGKVIEIIGYYIPTREPAEFECNQNRISHWIELGAQPSNTLARLLAKNGMSDMEKYMKTYTKKSKRKVSEEEEAPAAAVTPPVVESSDDKPATEEPVAEEPKDEPPATEPAVEPSVESAAEPPTEEPKSEPEPEAATPDTVAEEEVPDTKDDDKKE
ncbi:30S ribosomal protein S16 [Patescibacteria group bacterium]|nr:30S ribosomal protein S16 [Patescibacteria group bacterium]MBU1123687.1 30S ribosomal protein S16 [Patescibacteria group bacterium]MBU1910819.1 30S ribosomal protein S16 [Patescibacteria group bacterium]